MREIQNYLEAYGSVRLNNCFRGVLAENRMPYATLDDYLSYPRETRLVELLRIPNLGKKTATEFDELVVDFLASNNLVSNDPGARPSGADKYRSSDVSLLESAKPEQTPSERYLNLAQREKEILERRFGINLEKKKTLEETGQEFDVTRERIRQIESKAIRKQRSPHILQSWQLYVDENISSIMDAVFGSRVITKKPSELSGEFALAIAIVYGDLSKFLEQKAQLFEDNWVRPNLSILELQSARNRLASCVRVDGALPLSRSELAKALEVNGSIIEAAVSALDGYRAYSGWIIRGNATSRKRRIVNIMNLFHEGCIDSPVSLWDMKVAYWSNYDDKCSGRDLLLCLQEHKTHFVNLRELGWMCLTTRQNKNLRKSTPEYVPNHNIPDELYRKPVKTGQGLANCVYDMFAKHGPQRLSDAAEIFGEEYPEYAVSSMYPMLVYFAVFIRFAPGVLGIQAHCRDPDAVSSARQILLRERDLDLYLLSRAAGWPNLRYPLWDPKMEQLWANWLTEKEDYHHLGALLSVANIGRWEINESERVLWRRQKDLHEGYVSAPAMRVFSERRIDTRMLTTAFAAASIFGYVNWMYLNQALGWRIETTRVGLVLALLVRIGGLKPTGAWNEPHILTKRGREISLSIFGRSILSGSEARDTIEEFLEEPTDSGIEFGWAEELDFGQLLNQITDVSGQQEDDPGVAGEEDSAIEVAYEGFMGDELRRLIEGG